MVRSTKIKSLVFRVSGVQKMRKQKKPAKKNKKKYPTDEEVKK